MNNKEAISNLEDIRKVLYEVFPMTEEDKEQALDLAIKALETVDNSDKLNPTVYVVPHECIKVLADTVADVVQKIDWNSLIKIVAEKEAENEVN